MATGPQFIGLAHTEGAKITDAETTTKVTVFTPGASGSKIESIAIMSNNTAAVVLTLWITRTAVDYPIAVLNIAASTGTYQTTYVDPDTVGWLPLGSAGLPPMASGAVLKASVGTTLAAGKEVSLVVFGGDY